MLSLEQLTAERGRLDQLFRSLRVGARPSARIEPLEDADIEAIRHAIGPRARFYDALTFLRPPNVLGLNARTSLIFAIGESFALGQVLYQGIGG